MGKSTKLIKRCLALFLVVLMSIDSFAAIVGDSDGAVFVSKKEFEDLKNEFNAQIDRYNQSIDNKIDGKIAAYLYGLKVVRKKEESTIYAPDEGVFSLQSGSFPWTEGRMDMKFYGAVMRYRKNTTYPKNGLFEFELTTANPTNFSETLISDVDYDNGIGQFEGYYKTKQYFVSNGNNAKAFAYMQQGASTVTVYNGGYFPVSNQILTTYGQLYTIGAFRDGETTDYYGTNVLECQGLKASFRRETVDNNDNWTGGLILNAASMSHKFNNKDEYRDWCNDSETTGHSDAYSLAALGISGSGTRYDVADDNTVETDTANIRNNSEIYAGSAIGTQKKPYLGFVSTATNWNRIYIGAFDSQLDALLLDTDTNKTTNTLTDVNNKKHLKLGAGLPIIEANYEDKLTYNFEFKDKTKNYNVWVKEGSFDSSQNISSSYSNCIKDFTLDDGTTTFDSSKRALVIKNGVGRATFEIESKKTVVYIKWADYGSTPDNGGGILLPAKKVTVES